MNKRFRVSGSIFSKLEELGIPASAVLRRAGLPQSYVDQPRVLVSTEELFALWRAIGEVSTNPAIGLLLGTEAKFERFQPTGLAALDRPPRHWHPHFAASRGVRANPCACEND